MALILLMAATAGCWDALDIDRRAFIAAVGLDSEKCGQGSEPRVSLIIPAASNASDGGAGGGAGGGEEMSAKAMVMEESGANVEEAVEKMRAMVGGALDFSTLQYVAVAKDMNPDDFIDAMHMLHFTRFIPMTPLMFATEQRASEVLRAQSPSGRGIVDTLDSIQTQGRMGLGHVHYPQSWEVMALLINKTGDMALTVIDRSDQGDQLQAVGVAVYDGARYAGMVDPADSLALYCVAHRSYPGGVYPFVDGERKLLMRIVRARTRVKVHRGEAGVPELTVDMRVNATLMDSGGYRLPLLNRRKLDELEPVAERDMEARLGRLLERLQGWNSDAMRLYHEVRVRMPEMSYEGFKKIYPRVKVDFEVSVLLVRAGLLR